MRGRIESKGIRFLKREVSKPMNCSTLTSDAGGLASASSSDPNQHPLDNVIWHALTTVHARFAQGNARARRYVAPIAPFGASIDLEVSSLQSLVTLIQPEDRLALFTPIEVMPPPGLSVIRRAAVDQMILKEPHASATEPAGPIADLGAGDVPEMLELVRATQPGPFGPRTIELGKYIGVRWHGGLVAMAGERLRIDGYTEISAVCVHPAHRGHGFASNLVRTLVAVIAARSDFPFLHVFSTNHAAIALYHKLGFTLRRRMHLAVLGRPEAALSPER